MKLIFLSLAALVVVYVLCMFITFKTTLTNKGVQYVLDCAGIQRPDYKTLIISEPVIIQNSAANVWQYLQHPKEWKSWQNPLVISVRMSGDSITRAGEQFEQLLNTGFPLGKTTSAETVGAYEQDQLLAWWKNEKGVLSCHVWTVEQVSATEVLVTNTELFYGYSIALIKLAVVNNWSSRFRQTVHQLKKRLESK